MIFLIFVNSSEEDAATAMPEGGLCLQHRIWGTRGEHLPHREGDDAPPTHGHGLRSVASRSTAKTQHKKYPEAQTQVGGRIVSQGYLEARAGHGGQQGLRKAGVWGILGFDWGGVVRQGGQSSFQTLEQVGKPVETVREMKPLLRLKRGLNQKLELGDSRSQVQGALNPWTMRRRSSLIT